MQRDYWYSAARAPDRSCSSAREVGRIAGERTVEGSIRASSARSNARCCSRRRKRRTSSASSCRRYRGGSLYRKSSFLLDSIGQQVFAPHVRLREEPHLPACARQCAVRQRGRRHHAARRRARRRRAGLLPRLVLGAQARAWSPPATAAAATTSCSRTATTTSPALLARMGRGTVRHRAAGAGRQSRHRRFLPRRRRLLGRGRRHRLSRRRDHHRGQLARHVPRHRGRRQRRRPPRLASHGFHSHRSHDGRGPLSVAMAIAHDPRARERWYGRWSGGCARSPIRCASANNAARWIGQLPTVDAGSLQKEALELVSTFPGVAPRRRARAGRGAPSHRRPRRADHRAADAAVHAELPEEHEHRVAAVALACSISSRRSSPRTAMALKAGYPRARQQALARDPAVGHRSPRALPRARRQVPAVPLQPLDSRAVARVPRALRVRAHARLAARAARVRRRQRSQSRACRSSRNT